MRRSPHTAWRQTMALHPFWISLNANLSCKERSRLWYVLLQPSTSKSALTKAEKSSTWSVLQPQLGHFFLQKISLSLESIVKWTWKALTVSRYWRNMQVTCSDFEDGENHQRGRTWRHQNHLQSSRRAGCGLSSAIDCQTYEIAELRRRGYGSILGVHFCNHEKYLGMLIAEPNSMDKPKWVTLGDFFYVFVCLPAFQIGALQFFPWSASRFRVVNVYPKSCILNKILDIHVSYGVPGSILHNLYYLQNLNVLTFVWMKWTILEGFEAYRRIAGIALLWFLTNLMLHAVSRESSCF